MVAQTRRWSFLISSTSPLRWDIIIKRKREIEIKHHHQEKKIDKRSSLIFIFQSKLEILWCHFLSFSRFSIDKRSSVFVYWPAFPGHHGWIRVSSWFALYKNPIFSHRDRKSFVKNVYASVCFIKHANSPVDVKSLSFSSFSRWLGRRGRFGSSRHDRIEWLLLLCVPLYARPP